MGRSARTSSIVVGGILVRAVAHHAGEAEGDAAGVAREDLHAVDLELDIDDQFGTDHDHLVALFGRDGLQCFGLPLEELVG